MDIRAYNRQAWDHQVETGNPWTLPVSPEVVAAARQGKVEIVLTPTQPIPADWFPPLHGCRVLCLASGGGQQGPVLAAAGAQVTVFDNSPRQLERDREVAEREGLQMTLVEGDMRDLSCFADSRFDLIVHPISNLFVPDVNPVWRECFRVLRPGGRLLSGFINPVHYLFDFDKMDNEGVFELRHRVPYSDLEHLDAETLARYQAEQLPMEFGHSLEDQIGGQLAAGFVLTGFFEDVAPYNLLVWFTPTTMATRAEKPA